MSIEEDQDRLLQDAYQIQHDQYMLSAETMRTYLDEQKARQYADPVWMEREARRQAKRELERNGQFDVARLIEVEG